MSVLNVLTRARKAVEVNGYQTQYMAMHPKTGRPCSPKYRDAVLSFRGALIRASSSQKERQEVLSWMEGRNFLPRNDPRNEEDCIKLLSRAIREADAEYHDQLMQVA